MCGLAGIVTRRGDTPDGRLLERMADVQRHRGPDDGDTLVLEGAGLAHRRLTILDAKTGRQPMRSEDGRYALVYNGEIYNYRQINTELEAAGYRFDGHCDTETLLKAWMHWGPACVERLRGMFAFAIWDTRERRLHLVRDRLGIKPLYYGTTIDGDLVFASELKALSLHPRLDRTLDPRAIEAYMALGYVPEPLAIYACVQKLEPGQLLRYDANMGAIRRERYWDVRFEAGPGQALSDTAEALRARLDEAVRLRLVADVPLGAFLSGGLDSSAVVALMAGASPDPVKTCAIGFEQSDYDESAYARQVADLFSTDHREYRIDGNDFDLIDRLVGVYDEPFADSSALPTYRVCELARRGVKVVLSGDGGDENFAGYRRYRMHSNESRARARLPDAIRVPVFGMLGRAYPKLDWAPRAVRARTTFQALAMDTAQAYCHSVSMLGHDLRQRLYSPAFKRELQGFDVGEIFADHAARSNIDHPLSLAQYLDFKTWLPGDILTKVDRASMAHGLEVRVPLLDHEFVSWAATLSPQYKLHGREGKHVFKKALEASLPRDLIHRPKKGFSVPLAAWFRGPLAARAHAALTDGPLVESGLFDQHALSRLYRRHRSGRSDHGTALWSLLMLSRFLSREVGAPSRAPMVAHG